MGNFTILSQKHHASRFQLKKGDFIKFNHALNDPGTYKVTINELSPVTVKVQKEEIEKEESEQEERINPKPWPSSPQTCL